MTDVTLSAATQSALLLTKRTTALAARIGERIATGLRMTRAADDAAAFFVAQSLTRRAGDLLALKDGINQGVSALGDPRPKHLDSLIEINRNLARGLAFQGTVSGPGASRTH